MTENSFTKNDARHLKSIIGHCKDIEDAVSLFGGDEEDFAGNIHFQKSCAFSTSRIGEKVKRLSKAFTAKHPEVEWKDIAGFRDILSHDYDGVNLPMLWTTVKKDIPKSKRDNLLMLSELNGEK